MKKTHKYKISIRRKVVLMILTVGMILTVAGVGLGYFLGYRLLRESIVSDRRQTTQVLAESIASAVKEEIKSTYAYSNSSFWKKYIEEQNALYGAMTEEARQEYFIEMDKKWTAAAQDSPLVKEYTGSILGVRLKDLRSDALVIGEIFVTDKFGGLVAASGKTTDFYQADEEWWQEAYAGGKGKIFVSRIEFDESTSAWTVTIAVPVKDSAGNIIGVCKNAIDTVRFFAPLEEAKIGRTGHAVLIDDKGTILFHVGIKPLSGKFLNSRELQQLFTNPQNWITINESHVHKDKERVFVVYSDIVLPAAIEENISWKVCVGQREDEIFAPLYALVLQLMMVLVVLFSLMLPLGFIFGGIFVKPIKKLHEGTERIGAGDLDYKVEIKTGDELERLADSFNQMASDLKKTTISIDFLNKEVAERKAAEDKIRQAADEWQRTFDSIADLAFIMDKEFNIVKANKAFVTALKARPEDILGRKCYQIVHKLSNAWPDCPFVKAKGDMQPHAQEINDPKVGMPLLVSVSPIKNAKGEVIGAVHIARDISGIKKAEAALQESRLRYKSLYDSSMDAIMMLTPEKGFIAGNPATIKLFGCKDEAEFITKTPAELSPEYQPDGKLSVEKAQEMMAIAMDNGSHYFEWVHKTLEGREFFATVLLTRMELGGKKILQATVRDITEVKKAEEGIRRLASIVESSDDAIVGKDLEGNIFSWNEGAHRLYGYTEKEMVGKNISLILPAGRKHEMQEIIDRIRKEEKFERFETVRLRKDGRAIDVSLAASPIYDSAGKIIGVSAIARDISASKYLDRLKDEFISTVSHELRTPLSITKEGISLVLDGIAGKISEKQDKILKTSRDNINRLARIIDSLLDISKIEAGKLELQRRMICINELVKGAISSFEPKIKARGLELRLRFPQEEVSVYADKDKLIQVITNLISNALKFTEKGFIEVGIEKKNDIVECFVLDSGIGISGSDLPRIFNKFEQFGRAIGGGERGTGLGLSIVKGIIEKHKGSIRVESDLGKGSRVIFSLPVYNSESLFREHINEGIRNADKKSLKFALIIVSLANFDKIKKEFPAERIALIAKDLEKVFQECLRREGDMVAKDTGEILILLADCDMTKALIVQGRLEQAWDSYVAGQKFPQDMVKLIFTTAIYPDEAKSAQELIKKARV